MLEASYQWRLRQLNKPSKPSIWNMKQRTKSCLMSSSPKHHMRLKVSKKIFGWFEYNRCCQQFWESWHEGDNNRNSMLVSCVKSHFTTKTSTDTNEFFTIRSLLHFKLKYTSRSLKHFKKLPPVGIELTTLTITGSKAECLCATWQNLNWSLFHAPFHILKFIKACLM